MAFPDYQRTPLPKRARTRVGWIALCVLGLILSPFVGFTIHGKVAVSGLVIGLLFAILPFFGLTVIAILRWHAWRRLPSHIVQEWTTGRVVPIEGAPTVVSPVRFSGKKYWIELRPEGVTLSRNSLLGMAGVSQTIGKLWIADQIGEMFVEWRELVEWIVDIDSDGPNYYLLKLGSGGMLRIRRFEFDAASECDLLDAVRYVGKLPVRLRCDVHCKA